MLHDQSQGGKTGHKINVNIYWCEEAKELFPSGMIQKEAIQDCLFDEKSLIQVLFPDIELLNDLPVTFNVFLLQVIKQSSAFTYEPDQ